MLHLVHPVLVHFTVAFLVTGGLCEAFGIFRGNERVERFGGALVVIGALVLVPTVATGFLAQNTITPPPGSTPALEQHERFAIIALGVFLVTMLWKGWDRGRVRESNRAMYAVLLLVAVAVLLWVAYLGGRLVYEFGVGVGPV